MCVSWHCALFKAGFEGASTDLPPEDIAAQPLIRGRHGRGEAAAGAQHGVLVRGPRDDGHPPRVPAASARLRSVRGGCECKRNSSLQQQGGGEGHDKTWGERCPKTIILANHSPSFHRVSPFPPIFLALCISNVEICLK